MEHLINIVEYIFIRKLSSLVETVFKQMRKKQKLIF